MPNDIIDNRSQKLVDVINNILPACQSAKIAVGYFFLSGLDSVADSLFNIREIHLLIGNTTNTETVEQIIEGNQRLQEAQNRLEQVLHPKSALSERWSQETAQAIGSVASAMAQSDQNQQIMTSLARMIAEGRLKVKVYTKGRLHAKAYIFDYGQAFDAAGRPLPMDQKGVAVVGSSNLTLSGLTHNSELNVRVFGDPNHKALTEWFNQLWDEAKDFEPQLMQVLQQSWALAQVTPYEVYLKALYEFVKDRLSEDANREFLWQSEITAALADFQRTAVRRAIQVIRQYGGAFVSDVVGLGKSYIGAAILKHFERHDRSRSLIICPQSLVKMWEHYNEAYQLNSRVLSMGMLKDDPDNPEKNILMDEEIYQDRDFILIDESHNFRNPNTQKYKLLQTFLQSGDRRCVLLTATPRNKNIWDIYHQIKLYHVDEKTQIPINPPILREFIKKVDKGEAKAASLLSNVMVRRTRMDVLRWYGLDAQTHQRINPFDFEPYHKGEKQAYILVAGKEQYFPKRGLQTIEYNIDETYRGLYDQLLTHIGRPGEHHKSLPDQLLYARYGLWHFVIPEKQNQSPYNELQRAGANLRGLIRVSLFKRIESSVYAFRKTIGRMIFSHKAFLKSMEHGIMPAGKDAAAILSIADTFESDDELLEKLEYIKGKYALEDFEIERLKAALKHDLEILEKMNGLVKPITPKDDAKLQTLRSWLTESKLDNPPLASKKCLIFTQFADTADYLFHSIKDILPKGIEVIFGHNKDKALTAWRFSPKSNQEFKPAIEYPEINLLIATDVMSEGLNLQDCDQIINYDLHWNPVKLIQRFGRIDRIGTKHEKIFGFNFLPEKSLEKALGLKEKLTKRISEIQNMLGGDSAILDPSEQFIDQAFLAIYQGDSIDKFDPSDEDEDLVDLTEAEEFMRQLQVDNPELFKKISELKDGIRSAKAVGSEEIFAVCRAGEYRQIYSANKNGDIKAEDIPTALGKMKCEPDEPAVDLPNGFNQNIVAIQSAFEDHIKAWQSQKRVAISLTLAQKYIINELGNLRGSLFTNPDLYSQIDMMINVFSMSLTQSIQHEINGLRRNQVIEIALLETLEKIYIRYRMKERFEKLEGGSPSSDVPIIVCSLANK